MRTIEEIDALRARVAAIGWHHRIDLGDGIFTPGADDSPAKLAGLRIPASLAGWHVLDVGTWDGFFAFECERRGANWVIATDSYVWDRGNSDGFDLAKMELRSKVEKRHLEVLDHCMVSVGGMDLVLFLGVLYHMRHPLLALERMFEVTNKLLIVETHVGLQEIAPPAMKFYPGAELALDPSNWWGPNVACVEAMLRDVGFKRVEMFVPIYGQHDRRVFHAWKE